MLLNQHKYRHRIHQDLPTYQMMSEDISLEKGVVSHINNKVYGSHRRMLNDVGIENKSIHYRTQADKHEAEDSMVYIDAVQQFRQFMNTRWTQVDMSDYEHSYDGFEEYPGEMLLRTDNMKPFEETELDVPDFFVEGGDLKPSAVTSYMRDIFAERVAIIEARKAWAEETQAAILDDDDEGDDDDDDEEEGGEAAEEDEEVDDDSKQQALLDAALARLDKNQFLTDVDETFPVDNIREKHSPQELEAFMKLLEIKPVAQW